MLNLKSDFPIFQRRINGKPIIYLDSAATSLKPTPVILAITDYYQKYTANIFRGVYTLSEEATAAYEEARTKVANFFHAQPQEIVFVRNATEAINLVMYTWGRQHLTAQDHLITTHMEHHANFVPWQQLSHQTGAQLKLINFNQSGHLDLESLTAQLSSRTKLVALTHVSNVLGTLNPLNEIISLIKNFNPEIKILIDGAQAVPHLPVNVRELNCDWYVFSGHKMLGPTGIGVLWGKQALLEQMPPFQFGGEMIREVRPEGATFKNSPYKFEAGTPHIAGAIGLGAAVDYLQSIGMEKVRHHEQQLTAYALKQLSTIPDLEIIGPGQADQRGGVISFNLKGIHPHDVAQVLNEDNIFVRAGHHCAMPLHQQLHLPATVRASFYLYNQPSDINALIEGIEKVKYKFQKS